MHSLLFCDCAKKLHLLVSVFHGDTIYIVLSFAETQAISEETVVWGREKVSKHTSSTVCSWKSRPYEGPRRGKGPEGTILEGCLSTTQLLIRKGGLLHECFCFKIMSRCSLCLHVETLVGVNFYVKLTIKSIWKWLFFLHFLDRFIVINRSMLNDANRN